MILQVGFRVWGVILFRLEDLLFAYGFLVVFIAVPLSLWGLLGLVAAGCEDCGELNLPVSSSPQTGRT